MKNKLLVSSLMMICWIASIIFWIFTIDFLIKNQHTLFWCSAIICLIFSFSSKKLLKLRKELDIKIP